MSNNLLVLQSDFGLVDGAVSAMIGVALQESRDLVVHHLTHDITPYNIFEGSYRLFQTVEYWPEGTTFVSVVDPGVGSKRKSVVALTEQNHYIVTPDNGTLSFIKICGDKGGSRNFRGGQSPCQYRTFVHLPWSRCLCLYGS